MNNTPHQVVGGRMFSSLNVQAVAVAKRHLYMLLLALLASYSMLFYVDRIWAPGKSIHFCDLYPRWYGARELLLRGRDPYSQEVSQEIQVWSYGHKLAPEPGAPQLQDENRFAYPLYIIFVLAPFIRLSFPQTYELFRVLLPLVGIVSTVLWLRVIGWKCAPVLLTCVLLLSMSNFPMLESIYLQQPVLLAGAFLACSCVALRSNHLYVAGILLALATIKPQITALFAFWLLFWACCQWRNRKGVVIGFLVTIGALVGGAELLLPGWISEFDAGLVAYRHYTGTSSILSVAFGRVGGMVPALGLLLGVAWAAWRTRSEPVGTRRFYFTFSLVVVATLVVEPTMYPTGQILLLPVVFWLIKDSRQIWAEGRWARLTYTSVLILIAWPWFGSLVTVALHRVIPIEVLRSSYIAVLAPVLLVPVSLLGLLAARAKGIFSGQYSVTPVLH